MIKKKQGSNKAAIPRVEAQKLGNLFFNFSISLRSLQFFLDISICVQLLVNFPMKILLKSCYYLHLYRLKLTNNDMMTRASLCIAQYVPTYLSRLQKQPIFFCQEKRREYPKATYMHWRKLLVLFEPTTYSLFKTFEEQIVDYCKQNFLNFLSFELCL